MIVGMYYVIMAASWNLLAGYTGQFSLAHHTFAGLGGYASGLMIYHLGVPIGVVFIAAVFTTALIGFLLGRLVLKLIEPTGGKLFLKDQEITSLKQSAMKPYRRHMQMIFQDPFSSLNPRKNILSLISEPLKVHNMCHNKNAITEKVKEALQLVDLPCTDNFLAKMPDEISGGERQRIGIARALIIGAEFIVADEPVSMLDASVKAGVTALLMKLKQKIGLTYIFITHEIALAYYLCDRIAVMYLGKIVELGNAVDVIKTPLHPYTKLLMEAIPPLYPDAKWGDTILDRGELQSLTDRPSGCSFYPRCFQADKICENKQPEMTSSQDGHYVTCHQCASWDDVSSGCLFSHILN